MYKYLVEHILVDVRQDIIWNKKPFLDQIFLHVTVDKNKLGKKDLQLVNSVSPWKSNRNTMTININGLLSGMLSSSDLTWTAECSWV